MFINRNDNINGMIYRIIPAILWKYGTVQCQACFRHFVISSGTPCAVIADPQGSADPTLGNPDLDLLFVKLCL